MKTIFKPIDNYDKGRQLQFYLPEIKISKRHFFIGADSAFRINNDSCEPRMNYKCFAIIILGFGFGFAWWQPIKKDETP